MPGIVYHSYLAMKLWDNRDIQQLIRRTDRDDSSISDLWYGSLGPDMAVFRECESLLTDLCHYHLSGTLATELWQRCITAKQRTLVIGWISHLISDALLHRAINQEVGRIAPHLGAEVPYHELPGLHMRLEVGIDVAFAGRVFTRTLPAFMRHRPLEEADFLLFEEAYREAYGVTLSAREFHHAHLTSLGFARRLIWCAVFHDSVRRYRLPPRAAIPHLGLTLLPLAVLGLWQGHRRPEIGFARPLVRRSLIELSEEYLHSTILRTIAVASGDGPPLENLNLDLGLPEDLHPDYPPRRAALDRLRHRRMIGKG